MGSDRYSADFFTVSGLSARVKRQMAALYLSSYDAANEQIFFHDLANKHEALLVHADAQLVGFTTLRFFERMWQDRPIRVVYSGDTVVERKHWGQQALAFAWISRMGEMKRAHPGMPLYWLLMVKGHRTYRYLTVFGRSFYPHWEHDRTDLKPLADMLAAEMYPEAYNPASGVVEFPVSRGQLKPQIASPNAHETARREVQFFLERNPHYREGHELVCVLELEEMNLKPLTLRLFRKQTDALEPVESLS